MLKKNYQKPNFEVVELQIENSIANGSVKVGTVSEPVTPYIEDWKEGEDISTGGNGYQDI